jgi:hypothetical protein
MLCLYVLTHERELVRSLKPMSTKLATLPAMVTLLPPHPEFLYPAYEKTAYSRGRDTHSNKVQRTPATAWALLMTSLNPAGTLMHPVGTLPKLRLEQPEKLMAVQTLRRTTWAESGD